MKQTLVLRVLAMVAVLFLVSAAFAQNPHFVGPLSATINGDGSLTVSWKEAGLGNNQNIDYALSGSGVATYACQNNGGNFPKDPKKYNQTGNLTATGTFSSGQNGQIIGSLTDGPPPPASPSNCKGNQVEVLVSVSYSGITVTDTTNGVSISAADISRTFFVLP